MDEIKKEPEPKLDDIDAKTAALKKSNDAFEAELNRKKELSDRQLMGGKAEAGTAPKEMTNKEYAESVMRGVAPNAKDRRV